MDGIEKRHTACVDAGALGPLHDLADEQPEVVARLHHSFRAASREVIRTGVGGGVCGMSSNDSMPAVQSGVGSRRPWIVTSAVRIPTPTTATMPNTNGRTENSFVA
jgi:hypothetical protein